MNMLVVTMDPALSGTFREEANGIGVEAQACGDFRETHQRFEAAKYEAVVVDFDTFPEGDLVIASIRESRFSKNAVVFAVATNRRHMEQALQRRAHFVLNRPLETSALRRTLRVAYDLMLKDRRRHFRCATVFPIQVRIVRTQNILHCLTINVSSNGMAINAPEPLKLAETLEIEFALADGFRIRATGFVVWDDKRGRSGVNFQCVGPEMRLKLNSWLETQFNNQLRTGSSERVLPRSQFT
jgi:DNA-binding response OmpR family regulator